MSFFSVVQVFNIITMPMKEAEAANYKIVNKFVSSHDFEVCTTKCRATIKNF